MAHKPKQRTKSKAAKQTRALGSTTPDVHERVKDAKPTTNSTKLVQENAMLWVWLIIIIQLVLGFALCLRFYPGQGHGVWNFIGFQAGQALLVTTVISFSLKLLTDSYSERLKKARLDYEEEAKNAAEKQLQDA